MVNRDVQQQALETISRWYRQQRCHRIDQLLFDQPTFAQYVIDIYHGVINSRDDMPSKCNIASQMVVNDVPGFAEAVLALDRQKSFKDIRPRAERLAEVGGRAA